MSRFNPESQQFRAFLECLGPAGRHVEKIIVVFRRVEDGRETASKGKHRFDTDEYYQRLRFTMLRATNQIINANFDLGLTEDDGELSHALNDMKQTIMDLHILGKDRSTVLSMFDAAKDQILENERIGSLPDAWAKKEFLALALDYHCGLALEQIDNPQPIRSL